MLNLSMDSFKMDRTAFKGQTQQEAANHSDYYKKISWQERLKISAYLNSVAFDYDLNNPPRMDKTKFASRSIMG